jgi:hypothetical protein
MTGKEAGIFGSIGCFIIAGILFLSVAFPLGYWGFRVFFAEEIGRGNAEIEIQSAPSRIARYEEFFNLCVSVQNAEIALDAESSRLEATTNPDEQSTVRTNISGLTATRANGINQYNANALKDYTDGQFRASNLPYQLSTAPYVPTTPSQQGSTKTVCAT